MAKTPKSTSRRGRKQKDRAKLKPQDWTLGLSVVHPKAAGIDIGNEEHYVAVPPSLDSEPVRKFGCFTADLGRAAFCRPVKKGLAPSVSVLARLSVGPSRVRIFPRPCPSQICLLVSRTRVINVATAKPLAAKEKPSMSNIAIDAEKTSAAAQPGEANSIIGARGVSANVDHGLSSSASLVSIAGTVENSSTTFTSDRSSE